MCTFLPVLCCVDRFLTDGGKGIGKIHPRTGHEGPEG